MNCHQTRKGKRERIAACRQACYRRYGNSHTIWDHTVLPATRQRWHSRLYPTWVEWTYRDTIWLYCLSPYAQMSEESLCSVCTVFLQQQLKWDCIKLALQWVLGCVTFLQCLRQFDVTGKFVEFFGPGVSSLLILERTAIANMCPEYGATLAFFPMDSVCLEYLQRSGFCAQASVTQHTQIYYWLDGTMYRYTCYFLFSVVIFFNSLTLVQYQEDIYFVQNSVPVVSK